MVSPQLYIMIIDLFKIPFYKSKLFLDTQKISEYCINYQKNNPGRKLSNIGGYQSNDLIGEHLQLNDLFLQIENHGKKFADEIELGKLFLDNVWININEYKDFNQSHVHSNAAFSGVFYVKTSLNSGKIKFKHPSVYIHQEWSKVNKPNNYNSTGWEMPIEDNLLYLFPSWLEHFVEPNMSNDKRISISFNLGLTNE